eukprot:3545460-Prymnesium_polylepis.2
MAVDEEAGPSVEREIEYANSDDSGCDDLPAIGQESQVEVAGASSSEVDEEEPREVAGRTVACALAPIVINSSPDGEEHDTLQKLRDLVMVVNRIRRDAHELITHHVLRVLEAGEPVPELQTKAVVYRFFVAVTQSPSGQSKYPELDAAIADTRDSAMPGLVRHAWRTGLDCALAYECIRYSASLKTQIHRSFRQR